MNSPQIHTDIYLVIIQSRQFFSRLFDFFTIGSSLRQFAGRSPIVSSTLVRLKGGQFKLDDVLDSELSHIHRLDKTLTVPPPAHGCGEHFVCPYAGAAHAPRQQEGTDEQWHGPVALRNLLRSTPWPSLKDLTESYIDDALRQKSPFLPA